MTRWWVPGGRDQILCQLSLALLVVIGCNFVLCRYRRGSLRISWPRGSLRSVSETSRAFQYGDWVWYKDITSEESAMTERV